MVLTFHVPMMVSLDRERRLGPVASEDFRLSPHDVINLLVEESSSSRKGIAVGLFVDVSVAISFFCRVGKLPPCPTPFLGGPGVFCQGLLPLDHVGTWHLISFGAPL